MAQQDPIRCRLPEFRTGVATGVAAEPLSAPGGAVLLRNALLPEETEAWRAYVRQLHENVLPQMSAHSAPRRGSQHHLPCNAGADTMQPLFDRLRSVLPAKAGPGSNATLSGLSSFLRCYYYKEGDRSAPHYDRSFSDHEGGRGRLLSFSAFSLVLYLDDDFEGGETTFFAEPPGDSLTRSKLTLIDTFDESLLRVVSRVQPRRGDALLFPHGRHRGCFPSPLHEGSVLHRGEKTILRTDVVYNVVAATSPIQVSPLQSPQHHANLEHVLRAAVLEVCGEALAKAVRFSIKPTSKRNAGDLECDVTAQLFWAHRRAQQRVHGQRRGKPDLKTEAVTITSSLGVERRVTCSQLGALLVDEIERNITDAAASTAALVAVRTFTGPSAALLLTMAQKSKIGGSGMIACPRCGREVHRANQGLEWHLKNSHGVTHHATAVKESTNALRLALASPLPTWSHVMSSPHMSATKERSPADLAAAQRSPAEAVRLAREGKIRPLGSELLDACRSGDLPEVMRLVESEGQDPHTLVDRNGSGALLWAAGGGHLGVCRYLVEKRGVDASKGALGSDGARRGYEGRTPLHWAARNGCLDIVKWLVNDVGVGCDVPTTDGTTAFCWAAWTGHVQVCRFLQKVGMCDPHATNTFGCNAAMWAAQGADLSTCEYLFSDAGLDFTRLNTNGQGCLHKAAQRGRHEICEWLLQTPPRGPGLGCFAEHFAPNVAECSRPSDLARYAGYVALASWLQEKEAEVIRRVFRRDGLVVVRKALDASSLKSFREQVWSELKRPTIVQQQVGSPPVDLDDVSTWPSGGHRRVQECVPPGTGSHWTTLSDTGDDSNDLLPKPPLATVLNALLGRGGWELPANQTTPGEIDIRHWYCPVAFPEDRPGDAPPMPPSLRGIASDINAWISGEGLDTWSKEDDSALLAVVDDSSRRGEVVNKVDWARVSEALSGGRSAKQCRERWDELKRPWNAEEDAALLELFASTPMAWNAIAGSARLDRRTKRQVRSRVAQLFATNTSACDYILKRDRTEMVAVAAPEQRWRAVNRRRVLDKGWHVDIGPGFDTDAPRTLEGHPYQGCVVLVLLTDCPAGSGGTAFIPGSHEWVRTKIKEVVANGERGVKHQVLNSWVVDSVAKRLKSGSLRMNYEVKSESRVLDCDGSVVTQMVGSAGDVWLMHPWLVHSGTTNCGTSPRVMANGMARVTQERFDADGGCRLLLSRDEDVFDVPLPIPASLPEVGTECSAASYVKPTISQPLVSIIIPVHNGLRVMDEATGLTWLDECLESVLSQTYKGPIQISVFDDASDDGTDAAVRGWVRRIRERRSKCESAARFSFVVDGSRWDADFKTASAGGIGFAKNRAVEQSKGKFLCFLDVDDIMLPDRVSRQLAASIANPTAIIGAGFVRSPQNATPHFAAWANGMASPQELWLQQYRETTVLMPTWFMPRTLFDAVGGFRESPPLSGEAEDLRFFQSVSERWRHLTLHGATNAARDVPSILRVGDASDPLLVYRWTPGSGTSRVPRRRLIEIRAKAFEERVLNRDWIDFEVFHVWGAGRDARHFVGALSADAKMRVAYMIDVDPKKIGTVYTVRADERRVARIPVVHFSDEALGDGKPVVVCVSLRRGESALEQNVATLGRKEGVTLWFFN